MRFTAVFRSKESNQSGMIPKGLTDALENLAEANGYTLSSVIPESLMGKKFSMMMDVMTSGGNDAERKTDGSKAVCEDGQGNTGAVDGG